MMELVPPTSRFQTKTNKHEKTRKTKKTKKKKQKKQKTKQKKTKQKKHKTQNTKKTQQLFFGSSGFNNQLTFFWTDVVSEVLGILLKPEPTGSVGLR